jgi:hypothetical protein
MKSALIAAIVAAVISAGAGVAATNYISGSQIKPHSISANRLTPSAVKSLRGKRGPRGYDGAMGLDGATGATGAPGAKGGFDPSKLQYITGPTVTIAPGYTGSAAAYCPPGTAVVSGGFFSSVASIGFSETFGQTFHGIWAANNTGISVDIHATAVCAGS